MRFKSKFSVYLLLKWVFLVERVVYCCWSSHFVARLPYSSFAELHFLGTFSYGEENCDTSALVVLHLSLITKCLPQHYSFTRVSFSTGPVAAIAPCLQQLHYLGVPRGLRHVKREPLPGAGLHPPRAGSAMRLCPPYLSATLEITASDPFCSPFSGWPCGSAPSPQGPTAPDGARM